MREAILAMLAGWARLCHAEPLYTTLIGMSVALSLVVLAGVLFRARLFALERISGTPILIASALVVLGLCLVWAAVDGLLAWAGAPLLSEILIRALVPRDLDLVQIGRELGLEDGAGRDAVLRAIMGAPEAPGTPLLPGGVSLPLGLVLCGGVYYGIARLLGGTLTEMLALQRKPEDILREERRRRLEAEARARAEKAAAEDGDAAPGDGDAASEEADRAAAGADTAGTGTDEPWKAAAAAWAQAGQGASDASQSGDEVDPEQAGDPLPAPIPDDFWGRVYKLGGHFRSYRFVESRYLRWQKPLALAFLGWLALGAFPATGGYLPVPVWVGAAVFASAFWSPVPARDRGSKQRGPETGANEQAARPLAKVMPAFAERAEVSAHLSAMPKGWAPRPRPDKQAGRAPSVHAAAVLEQIVRAMDAHPMYRHQAAAAAAFDTRASVLVCTAPGSGRRITCDALSLYAVLADGERVLYLERDAARARIAHQRFEARAAATHWKWNVLAVNLADRAGTLDPSQAQPSLVFADADAVHRQLCGQSQRWQAFLAGLGTVVVPDLDQAGGAPAGHLAQLFGRLERLSGRARVAASGSGLLHRDMGETPRLRWLVTAHPGHENLARYTEQVIGRSVTVIGPRDDGAPRPRHDARVVAADWDAGGAHPALGVRDLAHKLGYRAALIGYEDVLTLDEREPPSGAVEALVARLAPATSAALPFDTLHSYARTGDERARAPSIAVIVQPDPSPMARLLAGHLSERASAERTAAESRAPKRQDLGRALVACPGAPSIERSHLRATLAECELSVDELERRFSRDSIDAELGALRAQGRLLQSRRRLLDPIAGDVRTVHSVRLATSEDVHAGLGLATTGQAFALCERATGRVLFELEGERARAAAYPGRVLMASGRRFEVLADDEQDQLGHGRILCQNLDTAALSAPIRTLSIEVIERRKPAPAAAGTHGEAPARAASPEATEERRRGSLRSLGGAGFVLEHRDVIVTETTTGVRRFDLRGRALDMSTYERPIGCRFRTRAAILGLLPDELSGHAPAPMKVLHALAHGFGQALPALVQYQPDHDLAIAPQGVTETWSIPSVVFVDLHPGGAGFAEAVDLAVLRRLCGHALDLMRACPAACEVGCPECLHVWTCSAPGRHHQATDKRGAMDVLAALLGPAVV